MILAIYGTGGGGKETLHVVLDILKEKKQWENIVFIDDTTNCSLFHGYQCFNYNEFKKTYSPGMIEVHISIGEIHFREIITEKVEKDGYSLARIIHPKSKIGNNVLLSEGILIKMGVIIEDNVKIGKCTWIQPYAQINENVNISQFCQVSAKSIIKENTIIANNVFIGMHAIVEKNIHIKEYSIISMGAVVVSNIEIEQICMGNPARVISFNKDHKVF